MSIAKLDEYKFLIPKIKDKAKALKNRRNRKVQRINIVSDPALALVSMTDVIELPSIKKENIFRIKVFFENVVLKQAQIELEKNIYDYKALYSSFRNSIMKELDAIENIFIKLNAKTSGFATKFFNGFGGGAFNDNNLFIENLEHLVTSFALKPKALAESDIFENIKNYLNKEKSEIIAKIGNINSNLPKQLTQINLNLFANSIILKPEEHKMISDWITEEVGAPKTFECLFNAKNHGFAAEDFHEKCDEKGPTIVFVETTTGKRFGGYANCSWPESNQSRADEKCFIFSLDLKEKFLHKKDDKNSIHNINNPSWGPRFGGGGSSCDFALYSNCNDNNRSYCTRSNTYDWGNRTVEDFAGSFSFKVENYEVYLVKQCKFDLISKLHKLNLKYGLNCPYIFGLPIAQLFIYVWCVYDFRQVANSFRVYFLLNYRFVKFIKIIICLAFFFENQQGIGSITNNLSTARATIKKKNLNCIIFLSKTHFLSAVSGNTNVNLIFNFFILLKQMLLRKIKTSGSGYKTHGIKIHWFSDWKNKKIVSALQFF